MIFTDLLMLSVAPIPLMRAISLITSTQMALYKPRPQWNWSSTAAASVGTSLETSYFILARMKRVRTTWAILSKSTRRRRFRWAIHPSAFRMPWRHWRPREFRSALKASAYLDARPPLRHHTLAVPEVLTDRTPLQLKRLTGAFRMWIHRGTGSEKSTII